MKEIEDAIKECATRTAQVKSEGAAMQLSQATLNLAKALETYSQISFEYKNKQE